METTNSLGAKSLSEHSSKFWSMCKPTHSELNGIKLALIVDDDEVGHVVVAQCLEPLGYKVKSNSSALGFLEKNARNSGHFPLQLMPCPFPC